MAVNFIALLTLSVWAVASPVLPRDPSPEVQDNTTTPAVPVVTVSRTFTVPAWSKTDTITQLLNCTRTNYVPAGSAPAAPTSTATHSAAPLLGRQTSSNPPTTTPPPPPPTSSSVRTITRTTWVYETSTHSGDLSVTDYLCSATVEYAYTVDATVTDTYTQTIWPKDHTVTATTTISCNRPTVPPVTSRPVPPPPPRSSSPPPSPPASTKLSSPLGGGSGANIAVINLVAASSSSSSSALPTPTPVTSTPPIAPTTTAALTPVTTLHITHTVYPRTTITATGYTTAWVWTCSATSAAPTSTSTSSSAAAAST